MLGTARARVANRPTERAVLRLFRPLSRLRRRRESESPMKEEVVPVYMVDQAIVELRRRADGRDRIPVMDAVDVLLELRECYGVDLETAKELVAQHEALWGLGS
jgi:hypothetical protein